MAGPNALKVNRMFSRARAKIVSKLQVALSRCAPSRCAPVYPPDLSWRYFFHQIRSHDIPIRSVFDVGVAAGTPELYSAFPDADLFLFDPTRQAAQHMQKIATERSAVMFNVALGEKMGQLDCSFQMLMRAPRCLRKWTRFLPLPRLSRWPVSTILFQR